jgi:hypothetical protein
MELIIAIVIVVAFIAVWYNRRSPATPVVEAETFSDNGIKFTAKEETPAPVAVSAAPAPVVAEPAPAPAKKPRAKKPAATTTTKAKKAPVKAKKPAAK